MRITSFFSYVVSGLFVFLSLWVAEGSHLNILEFWDISSFILILGSFLMVLVNFKFSEVFNAIADALTKKVRIGFEERYNLDKLVISSIGTYTMYASILMFILASIIVASNLTEIKQLGPSFAVTSTVILYAMIIKLFLITPLNTSLDKKITEVIK